MGCCGPKNKINEDFPYEEIEEFNKLKSEINEIINDKEHPDRKNINKLLELFNKTSNKLTEYENEVKNLKDKNKNLTDDMIKGLNEDIKQLKKFNQILNDLIKESDGNENINMNQSEKKNNFDILDNGTKLNKNELIVEEINTSNNYDINNEDNGAIKILKYFNYKKNNLENFLENDIENGANANFKNDKENDFKIESNNMSEKREKSKDFINGLINEKINNINSNSKNINKINNISYSTETKEEKGGNIYYKKSVRRNKKSDILNRKSKSQKKSLIKKDLFGAKELKNANNTNYNIEKKNKIIEKNENILSKKENNLINLIFDLENGQKIELQVDQNEKILDIIEKFDKNGEEYNNIENIELFNGNDEITENVKNGNNISSFGFNNGHIIQIKLKK